MKRSLAVLAILSLAACAAIQGQTAADSEEILAEAGFQRHPLDEPGLPARHLVEDAGTYKFADPDFCRCVYLGGAKEYAALQQLRAARLAEREWIQRRTVAGNSLDLYLWGPWKPEGLEPTLATVAARSPALVTTDTAGRPALH